MYVIRRSPESRNLVGSFIFLKRQIILNQINTRSLSNMAAEVAPSTIPRVNYSEMNEVTQFSIIKKKKKLKLKLNHK
jgi:hypothetical protein